MVVCEMTLRYREQLLFGITCELRPALAIGNPPVPSVRGNCGHVGVGFPVSSRTPHRGRSLCCRGPVTTARTLAGDRWRYVSRSLPAPAATERTRIQLCGSLSIEIDGVALAHALRGRQVPLLLAYLALSRDRAIGRDELSGALWPEAAPRYQDAALRTLLSRLRPVLGAEVVTGR